MVRTGARGHLSRFLAALQRECSDTGDRHAPKRFVHLSRATWCTCSVTVRARAVSSRVRGVRFRSSIVLPELEDPRRRLRSSTVLRVTQSSRVRADTLEKYLEVIGFCPFPPLMGTRIGDDAWSRAVGGAGLKRKSEGDFRRSPDLDDRGGGLKCQEGPSREYSIKI